MSPERELAATVLWLRNHIDVGNWKETDLVIKLADAMLAKHGDVGLGEYGDFARALEALETGLSPDNLTKRG